MVRTIIRLTLVAAVVGTAVAFKMLGWWAVLVVPTAALLLGGIVLKLFGERILVGVLSAPFKAKGAVLRDAVVEVHGVRPADGPIAEVRDDDDDSEEEQEAATVPTPLSYYWLDATITPAPGTRGPFQLWEPGELLLVPPGTDLTADRTEDEASCRILKLQIAQDGELAEDEGMKYPGPQRLQLGIGVRPGVRELQFQYYFETFGQVRLPA